MKSKNIYALPVRIKCRKYRKSPAHVGRLKHSVDFAVAEGTTIYAVAPGRVVYLRQSSKVGGPHRRFWNSGNRIVIEHRHGEFSAYEHLMYQGAKVRLGQKVRRGQIIAFSGNTGYSFGPHLHFEIFCEPKVDRSEGLTVNPQFV